jgi:hypothetical protein
MGTTLGVTGHVIVTQAEGPSEPGFSFEIAVLLSWLGGSGKPSSLS